VWARDARAWAWLREFLTEERLRELIPEARGLPVERYEFPSFLAVNFLIVGLLGEGVASSTRSDPQAKTLSEYLRARFAPIPVELLETESAAGGRT
jgi:lipid-binding SYLF domain-containing protein